MIAPLLPLLPLPADMPWHGRPVQLPNSSCRTALLAAADAEGVLLAVCRRKSAEAWMGRRLCPAQQQVRPAPTSGSTFLVLPAACRRANTPAPACPTGYPNQAGLAGGVDVPVSTPV